jgi:signal transduction histidine kinase
VPEDRIGGAVYAEQIAAVFRQMPIALAVNPINAALVAIVLDRTAGWPVPALWFGAVALITVGRAVVWWRYRGADGAANPQRWSIAASLGALLAGLSWGLGGAVMFPPGSPLIQLFLTMVIGGMCAGAVVISASHQPAQRAFLLAACLPMAGRFMTAGTSTDRAVGAMIVVFAAAMALAGKHLNRILGRAMRLRLELDQANRRLREEMAEHRVTEAALLQAQKIEAIGRLTGSIAHDFNNLLAIVIGNLAMAKEHSPPPAAAAQAIENAAQAAQRGAALIQRMLGFAREQRLDPQRVDLGELIASAKEILSSTLGPQIELVLDVPADIAAVVIDRGQLELAILNLAINARDAMPAGGTLRIGIANRRADATAPRERAADYVVLEMTDTGIGMDEETLAQAFEPFFTTKEPGIGTGLGLSTVHGFVVQSGGAVRLSSRLGGGTTVELWLPTAGAAQDAFGDRPGAG